MRHETKKYYIKYSDSGYLKLLMLLPYLVSGNSECSIAGENVKKKLKKLFFIQLKQIKIFSSHIKAIVVY